MSVSKADLPRATFTDPLPYGYLYLGMRVDPPTHKPFVTRSTRRSEALRQYKELAGQIAKLPEVVLATVYQAVLIPPVKGSPRFDVIVLIRTQTPESIAVVEDTEVYRQLNPDFVMKARNVRRIGDLDASNSDTFLFNHFTAADSEGALRTWEDVAAWFIHKGGVDNSVLMKPVGESPFVFVNHVRLPCSPIRFLLRFTKPSFRKHVTAKLNAYQIGNAPIICTPV